MTLLLILFGNGIIFSARAENSSKETAELTFRDENTAALQQRFLNFGYTNHLPLVNYRIPPLFLEQLPPDWAAQDDEALRNSLFIRIMAPLALKINKNIDAAKEEVGQITKEFSEKGSLSAKSEQRLEELAESYDIFTRLKDNSRQEYLLRELTLKIDNIPPSLLIAAAAIATDWGTSRAARRGNALYKEYIWNTKEGLLPENRVPGENYRIKTYPDLYASMADFAHKINSGLNFEGFRSQRRALRLNRSPLDGRMMAHNFIFDTHLQNYAGLLDYVITFYELSVLDKSTLANTLKKQPLAGENNTKKSDNDKNCNKIVIGFLDKNKLLCKQRLKNIGNAT